MAQLKLLLSSYTHAMRIDKTVLANAPLLMQGTLKGGRAVSNTSQVITSQLFRNRVAVTSQSRRNRVVIT